MLNITDENGLTETDRKVLDRALRLQRNHDANCAEQIESMLETRTWFEVASFAAYCCQGRALRCKPWEAPPCVGTGAGAALLEQMLAAGVSQWEPDPMRALQAAMKAHPSVPARQKREIARQRAISGGR
jgi:hypothetical protein